MPHSQFADDRNWTLTQVVRSSLPPEVLLAAIGQTLTKIDPELVLHDVRTLGEVAATGIARQRFAMVLMGIFSAVALLLAATGIYGVIAYSVSQRLKEIGIRKVLGAQESNLWRWIMVEGLAPVAGGIGAGNRGCVLVGALSLLTGVRGQRDRSDNDGHQHIGVGCGRGRRRGLPGMVSIANRSEHGVEKGIDRDQPKRLIADLTPFGGTSGSPPPAWMWFGAGSPSVVLLSWHCIARRFPEGIGLIGLLAQYVLNLLRLKTAPGAI